MRHARPTALAARATALLLLTLGAGGCETVELAPGEMSDIYVAADRALWEQIGDTLSAALQPTVMTVTDELAFQVVDMDPAGTDWQRVRTFKQILLFGTADDPWIQPALEIHGRDDVDPPGIFSVRDVWSRNQLVTVVLLESDDPGPAVERIDELREHYESVFRNWALARMFVSGRDSALADTLAREGGFSLLLPRVYQWDGRDSTWLFRNDNPSPDELIRQIAVTWRSPIPDPLDPLLASGPLLEWRQEVVDVTVATGHVLDTGRVRAEATDHQGRRAFEVQAVWQNPPSADWPAAGPFITRAVACPGQDRLYLLDAWLYAPGRDKYEYMIQLETILDSFRCGGG